MTPENAITVGEFLQGAVPWLIYACTLFSLRLWWRTKSRSSMWLGLSFVSFAVLMYFTQSQPESGESTLPDLVTRVLIVVILAFPYLLARFADSITGWTRRLRWLSHAVFIGAVLVMNLLLGTLLEASAEEQQGSPAQWAILLVFVVEWGGLLLASSLTLFSHSRGRASIVRRRLRLMAAGSFVLGIVILATLPFSNEQDTSAPPDPDSAQQLITNSMVAVSAILFLLGFAPPKALRSSWRREDEEQLYNAAISFMAAEDPDAVTRDIVPRIRDVLGSPGVAILDDGDVVARAGTHVALEMGSVREIPMGQHTLLVQTDPSMPLLNEGDSEFVSRLGVLADLALERARLMQAEKEAKTDLEAVNAELESFVYTTSHDLKNPIIAMLGYIDLLKSEYTAELPPEAQRFVDRMQANAAYMEALIRDLLELSRVGRVEVEPDLVALENLLDGVADDVTNRFPEVAFSRGSLPDLWMNPTRARQLFGNLIENAAKYGGDAVAIEVTAEQGEHGWWHLTVADNGKGIPQEYLERVFGVFERLEANKDGGTGMGLAICRRIVEQAGGHIHAVPSDAGARFQIDLPAPAVPTAPLMADNEEGVLQ